MSDIKPGRFALTETSAQGPDFPAALRGVDRMNGRFDSSRVVVVPAYSFRERTCEEINARC